MIKFSEMYQPLRKGRWQVDIFDQIGAINEHRQLKRTETYMHRKDIIRTYDKKEGRKLVITSRGKKIFYEDFPLAKLRKKKWDGFWTIVMYDFKETERRRRKYSPLPIHEEIRNLIRDEKMEKEVWVLRAERILGMENQEVVQAAWPLEKINYFYKKLIGIFPEAKKESLLGEWAQIFLAVNAQDPYLPRELLPEDWKEEGCKKLCLRAGEAGFLRAVFSSVV